MKKKPANASVAHASLRLFVHTSLRLFLLLIPSTSLAQIHFTIDAAADIHPISRFIYGINQPVNADWSNATLTRLGGNRWTAYNWTNNASNAGNDWHYQNDGFLRGGDEPGGAMIAGINNARDHQAGIILTVPMAGYVSADKKGDGDVRNSGPDYLSTRFRVSRAFKNAPFTITPDPYSQVVYQDEMVNWVMNKFPWAKQNATTPIWFMLDNEPDLWASTHEEVHADHPSYAEMVRKTIEYSLAIKSVAPHALVLGPANYGWNGFVTFQNAPDAYGRDFQEYYLRQLAAAEKETGKRLLDSLDVHWYPEVRYGGVRITDAATRPTTDPSFADHFADARMQAPRSLWDDSYVESSWIAQSLHAPIRLIPRLLDKINRCYSGTKLSISEYNFGGPNDISGAIAEADVLGIFGRDGVFAANQWPSAGRQRFITAGFRMFRDFDGHGATFGDTSIHAATDDVSKSSIYAAVNSSTGALTGVAINKTRQPLNVTLSLNHSPDIDGMDVFELTGDNPQPHQARHDPVERGEDVALILPPLSVTTIRFTGTTPARNP